jgi:hypothetical protein
VGVYSAGCGAALRLPLLALQQHGEVELISVLLKSFKFVAGVVYLEGDSRFPQGKNVVFRWLLSAILWSKCGS